MRATVLVFCLSLLLVGVAPAVDSLNVRLIGSCDTPDSAYGVAVSGVYAYVADMDSGLRVISVFDPAHPAEVGYSDTPGVAVGAAASAEYAYVADWTAGLRVISVSDPSHPVEVGYYGTPGYARGVAVIGDYVYVADNDAGLRVVSAADPAHPVEAGYYDTPSGALCVAVVGGYAYVGYFSAGLRIYQFYGAGVQETMSDERGTMKQAPTIVRGVLMIGDRGQKTGDRAELLDVSGRKVLDLKPGPNDVRALAPGVYFVQQKGSRGRGFEDSRVPKVIVTR